MIARGMLPRKPRLRELLPSSQTQTRIYVMTLKKRSSLLSAPRMLAATYQALQCLASGQEARSAAPNGTAAAQREGC